MIDIQYCVITAVQESDSVIRIYIMHSFGMFFSSMIYHMILNTTLRLIQQDLIYLSILCAKAFHLLTSVFCAIRLGRHGSALSGSLFLCHG